MADALPRERWVLAGIVLFVVFGGLFPNATVIEHSSEVDVVDQTIRRFDIVNRGKRDSNKNAQRLSPSTTPIATLEVDSAEQRPMGVHP